METPNEINSILTNQERDQILYSLFLWKDWKVDSSFLYKWKWAELYEKISKDETYPFIDTEIETLKEYNKYLEFEDNMVYYYQSPYKYIVYKNGKLLDNLEVISIGDNSKYAQYISFETYDFYITNNYDDYCVKNKQNNEIECYDEITTISNFNWFLTIRKL